MISMMNYWYSPMVMMTALYESSIPPSSPCGFPCCGFQTLRNGPAYKLDMRSMIAFRPSLKPFDFNMDSFTAFVAVACLPIFVSSMP